MDDDCFGDAPTNEELAELFLVWKNWNDSLIALTQRACFSSSLLSIAHSLEEVRESTAVAIMGHIHGRLVHAEVCRSDL